MKIVFIGAGHVATHLANELKKETTHSIEQIYSRTIESAVSLAQQVGAKATDKLEEIQNDADLYIFSVKDSVLEEIISRLPKNKGLWIHTSGSISMDVFVDHTDRSGVLYPLQTFNKDKKIDFRKVPIFIEALHQNDLDLLHQISSSISDKVYFLSSEKRKTLHLAAVFANNFVNHMYAVSEELLNQEGLPFGVLQPLIDETTNKIHQLSPKDAQTGPAIRYDQNVINKHLELLDNPTFKKIYQLISQSIHQLNQSKS